MNRLLLIFAFFVLIVSGCQSEGTVDDYRDAVTVVPKSVEITGSTRAASQYDIAIDIGVQKKLGNDLDVEVAALGALVDETADYLRSRTLEQAPFAVWVGISNDQVYVPEHLAQRRVFTSVLTVTYRAVK